MKLFDLDGTLIDSNGMWQEVDYRFLAAHNLPVTDEYLAAVGRSIFPVAAQYTIDYYNLDLSPQAIMDEWMSLARDAYEHHIPLKPGVREYLMQESARGEELALVSACVPELGHAVLNRHGLTPLFHHLIFAQEFGLEKHDPTFYDQVLSLLGASAHECIFYEDSPSNCATAKSMGMTVIGVLDPLYAGETAQMQQLCDCCIRDFSELL